MPVIVAIVEATLGSTAAEVVAVLSLIATVLSAIRAAYLLRKAIKG